MSPLRSDPTLWFNLPGVVAAYQPVAAPDSLLAQYNICRDSATSQRIAGLSHMTWSHAGWSSNPSRIGVANTGIYAVPSGSFITRWDRLSGDWGDMILGGNVSGTLHRIRVHADTNISFSWVGNMTKVSVGESTASGVAAMSQGRGFWKGLLVYQRNDVMGSMAQTYRTEIGYKTSYTKAFLVALRPLSDSEIWHASRQMQYCDVNPDWSAWGRRRRWYYGPEVAAAALAYRRRMADVGRIGSRGVVE